MFEGALADSAAIEGWWISPQLEVGHDERQTAAVLFYLEHVSHAQEWAQRFERKRECEQQLNERACVVVRGTTHGEKMVERP